MILPILNKTLWTSTLVVLLALIGTNLQADPAEATVTSPAGALTVATTQDVSFTATSTDSVGRDGYTVNSFSWSFGDGTSGSGSSTTHRYTTPGIYTATLTVSYTVRTCKRMDLEGNCISYLVTNLTATARRDITVLSPPNISNFAASAVSVGVGKPVTLTWVTANATSLTLSGQGPVSGTSVTVYPTTPTTYTLTASNSVGSVSASLSVTTYTVGVSLTPASASLLLGESRAFTAAVVPANQGVSWSTSGGSLSGSTSTGTSYLASASGSYSVVATSLEDPNKSATATVTVAMVSVATPVPVPTSAQTYIGGTVTFSAIVSGAVDKGVNWAVNGGGEITASGVFRANARGDWTITATSKADPTRSASALVHVLPLVVTVNPPHPTVRGGQTQAFTAAVEGPGTPSQSVTWQVMGSNSGSISSDGIYTAPNIPGDYTVRVISNQDTAAFATATVHVPGWALKWRKDIVYLGTREISELDSQGAQVTLVDHLGSPRFQLGPAGTVESVQKFLPFGEPLTDPSAAATFAKGFTNHEQTDPSGLVYMQARFYAPWYGRFLSPDPARDQHFEETQSWNIYSYVQNNPTMVIDPTGEAGILSGIWQGIKAAPGNWARSWGSAFKQDSTLRGYGSRVASSTLGPTGAAMLSGTQRGVALGKEMVQEAKTNGAGGVAKVLTREVGTEVINLAVSVGLAKGIRGASGGGAAPEATPALNAAGEPAGAPGIIYRGGGSNPGNLTLRAGEEGLSFRDSLSNPVGGPAVLRPGQPYIGVDAAKLPPGSVVADGVAGSKATPPGHVSVKASPEAIQAAIVEKGKKL